MQTVHDTLRALDAKAVSMNQPDIETTQGFVRDVLNQTSFKLASGEAAERCVRAEHDYRNGLQKAITEGQIVIAVNNLLQTLAAPGSQVVSEGQVHMLRVQMLVILPHLLQSPTKKEGAIVTKELSPAAAIYLASLILYQKMLNPLYQKTPDEWIKYVRGQSIDTKGSGRSSAYTTQVPTSAVTSFNGFKQDIADPSTDSGRSFQTFLDDLSLAK